MDQDDKFPIVVGGQPLEEGIVLVMLLCFTAFRGTQPCKFTFEPMALPGERGEPAHEVQLIEPRAHCDRHWQGSLL